MRAEGQEDLVTLTFDHGSPARKIQNKGVIRVRFQPESEVPWQMSAENLESLKNVMRKNETELTLRLIVEIEFKQMRLSPMKDPRVHSLSYAIPIKSELRKSFLDILATDLANATINGLLQDDASMHLVVPYALPNFVIVQNEGESLLDAAIEQNSAEVENECQCNSTYNDLNMKIAVQDSNIYWTAGMKPNSGLVKRELNFDPMTVEFGLRHNRYLEVFAFVDRAFPKNVPSYVVKGGIIGMYIVVVLTFGQLTRRVLANAPHVVPVDKTPNPDRLLLLCHELYLARELKDFALEQKLFWRLILILRSNVVFMRVTEEEAT
uniref:Piezo non-specific cation channel R-Ras-binding domain-containing protein n=1 Tax=Ditylenchus dipsaci TaxID=166011 RepID=A0A915CMQ6_9BILA